MLSTLYYIVLSAEITTILRQSKVQTVSSVRLGDGVIADKRGRNFKALLIRADMAGMSNSKCML